MVGDVAAAIAVVDEGVLGELVTAVESVAMGEEVTDEPINYCQNYRELKFIVTKTSSHINHMYPKKLMFLPQSLPTLFSFLI